MYAEFLSSKSAAESLEENVFESTGSVDGFQQRSDAQHPVKLDAGEISENPTRMIPARILSQRDAESGDDESLVWLAIQILEGSSKDKVGWVMDKIFKVFSFYSLNDENSRFSSHDYILPRSQRLLTKFINTFCNHLK